MCIRDREYTGQVMLDGITAFLKQAAPGVLPATVRAPNEDRPQIPDLSKTCLLYTSRCV